MAGGDRSFGLVDPFIDLVVCVAVARSPEFEEDVVWAWLGGVDLVKLVGCVVLRESLVSMYLQVRQSFAYCDDATTPAQIGNRDEPLSSEQLASETEGLLP